MLIMYLLFFLLINLMISHYKSVPLVEVQPVTFGGFVLVLFFLGFLNKMWFIDYIVLVGLCAVLVYIWSKVKRKKRILDILPIKKIVEPSFIIFLIVTVVGMLLLSKRGVYYFDETNFWGTDIKAIYFLQGYAEKGMNCAEAYGDYPPGYQLVAAWAMHILGFYNEGIQMSAYFLILMIFSAPVISRISNRFIQIIGATMMLPVMFAFAPDILIQRSPDVLMAATYGCALVYLYRYFGEKKNDVLVAIILANTVLIKSIGIQWAFFAVLFYLFLHIWQKKEISKTWRWYLLPFFVWGTWMLFCKINNRRSYSTYAVRLLTDERNSSLRSQYGIPLFKNFLQSLFMAQQPSIIGVGGVSIVAVLLVSLILIWCFAKKGFINQNEKKALRLFLIITWFIEYLSLLYSVENMFIGEYANYLQLENMLALVKRYGSPYVIGATMLLISIGCDGVNRPILDDSICRESGAVLKFWTLLMAFILFFSPWEKLYQWFYGYRYKEAMLEIAPEERDPAIRQLFSAIDQIEGRQSVVFLCDETTLEPFSSILAQYYCSPMPVMFYFLDKEWPQYFDYNLRMCTAICFITDNPDWGLMKEFALDSGVDIKINKPYYLKVDVYDEVYVSEQPVFDSIR